MNWLLVLTLCIFPVKIAGFESPSNVTITSTYVQRSIDGVVADLSILKVEWENPINDSDIFEYEIVYKIAHGDGLDLVTINVSFSSLAPSYKYEIENIVQGECYNVTVNAVQFNGTKSPSPIFTCDTVAAVPFDILFEPRTNPIQGNITWKVPGKLNILYYNIDVVSKGEGQLLVFDSYKITANSTIETMFSVPLLEGGYYYRFYVMVFKQGSCDSQPEQGKTVPQYISYAVVPPTPFNIQLSLISYNSTSLLVTYDLNNGFLWIKSFITFISDLSNITCSHHLSSTFNTTTTIKYEADPPNCILNYSTSYFVTVQLENESGQDVYGEISEKSNMQVTVPAPVDIISVIETKDYDGYETGKLQITWSIAVGGDAIDNFVVHCSSDSLDVKEPVPDVAGQITYEHITTKLTQGENTSVAVIAINSAGNSSYITFYNIRPPIPYNVTLSKPTDGNPELDCYVSWEMPSDGIASNFFINYYQKRGDPIQLPVYVQAPSLNGTISATCPGEILSVLMESYYNGYVSPTSKMPSWYQTDIPTPTNVRLFHNNISSLNVSWDSDACTVDYRIKFHSLSGDVLQFEERFPSVSSPTTYSDFIPGQMYQATVQSFTEYGQGALSLPTFGQTEPHHVANLSIELDGDSPSAIVNLSWETIGVGDNITIISRNTENMDNNTSVVIFSNRFVQVNVTPGSNYSFYLFVSSYFLTSSIVTGRITTKPKMPIFNVSATSMTSIRIDWFPVEGNCDYYVIESGNENTFSKISLDASVNSIEIDNLVPYAEYKIVMYSAVIDLNGLEEKSLSNSKKILAFKQEYCEEEELVHPGDKQLVTFPRTQAGYSNTTVETCPSQEGVFYGTRLCSIDAKWNAPTWISSCGTTLDDLEQKVISDDEDRQEVASDLSVLTSNSSSLSSDSIQQSASVLESIVDAEELGPNITSLVIESVGNLLSAPEEELQYSGVQEDLLMTLEEVAKKVHLDEGEEFQETTSTLAMGVVQTVNKDFTSIGFKENFNPLTKELGFSQEQFQTFYSNFTTNRSSSIFVPLQILSNRKDKRVSFYAFADDTLFQVSKSNSKPNNDVIDNDATIQSNVILSASIQNSTENLTENITIVFNYTQPSCPGGISLDECGEYLCGYWDEEQSAWSKYGCTVFNMSKNIIECKCNHLTNFASLFAYGSSKDLSNNKALDVLTYICCSVSLFGSLMTIVCLLVVRTSKSPVISNTTTFIMINLASALTLLNGFLLISNLNAVIKDKDACTAIAVLLHFSLFATLLWTTVEASYICLGVVKPLYYRNKLSPTMVMIYSSIMGWIFPAMYVAVLAGLKISWYQRDEESTTTCWIIAEQVLYLVILPASVIMIFNTIIYFVVIVSYFKPKKIHKSQSKKTENSTTAKSIVFSFSLFVMFGITWIFGFLLFGSTKFNEVFAYIFTLTTGLQGIFIFLLFVVRNKKIRQSVNNQLSSWQNDLTRNINMTTSMS